MTLLMLQGRSLERDHAHALIAIWAGHGSPPRAIMVCVVGQMCFVVDATCGGTGAKTTVRFRVYSLGLNVRSAAAETKHSAPRSYLWLP